MQSRTKCLAKSKKMGQNWRGPENFDISFCLNFDDKFQILIYGGETGH